jgi:hypothetical protein
VATSTRPGLFQLGSAQFLIVVAGIVTVLTVCYIATSPTSDEAYVRIFKLERMERAYGFKYGKLTIAFSGERYEVEGIVRVTAGGAFDQLGVRAGDRPFGYHCCGLLLMSSALDEATHGHESTFEVVSGEHDLRTITVPPRFRPPGVGAMTQ